jgi:hypothetical protein
MKVKSKMKKRCLTTFLMLAGLVLAGGFSAPDLALTAEYHGADSVFKAKDVGVIWAILKGADEAHSTVVIRIENLSAGKPVYQRFSVSAVHPFSGAEKRLVINEPFGEKNLVKSSRASFRDMPGRRIFLYKTADDSQPDMVIYYMSIPDTAPEFLKPEQLDSYLDQTVERLKK